MMSRIANRLRSLGPLIFTGALIAFVLAIYDTDTVLADLGKARVPVLAVAGALLAVNQLLSCARFHVLLRDLGLGRPFRVSLRTNIFSIVGGMLLFNFFGQSLTRFAFDNDANRSPAAAFIVTAIERSVALALLMILATIGALVLFGKIGLDLEKSVGLVLIVVNLAAVTAGVFCFGLSRRQRLMIRSFVFGKFLWPVIRVGFVTLAMHAAMMAAYVVLAATFAPDSDITTLVAVAAIVMLAAALPISFAGWGVREFSAAYVFGKIGMLPEAGVAMAVAIGLLSIAALLANTAVALVVGRSQSPALAPVAPAERVAAPFLRLLSWIGPVAVAALVTFQVKLPTATSAVNVNLADPIAIVGGVTLTALVLGGGKSRFLWRVPHLNLCLALATAALGLGFVHGWLVNGLSDCALYNRLIGWAMLMCFMFTGTLVTAVVGRVGVTALCRTYVTALVTIVVMEICLRLVDLYVDAVSYRWPAKSLVGMLGNPNAFAFQLVVALAVSLSALSFVPHRWAHAVKVVISGLVLAGLWFAESRAGFVGAIIVILIQVSIGGVSGRRISAALAVATAAVAVVFGVRV